MQTSKWRMFTKLYTKEMRELQMELLVFSAAVLLIGTLLFTRATTPVVAVPVFLGLGIAGFIPFLASIRLVWREWSNNTVYLIQALPVNGSMVLGAKLLAVSSQFVINTLVVSLTGAVLILSKIPADVRTQGFTLITQHAAAIAAFVWLIGTGFVYYVCLIYSGLMVGKLSRTHSLLFSIVAVFGINILINNVIGWVIGQITWQNQFPNTVTRMQLQLLQAQAPNYMFGSGLIYLLLAAILFITASIIYDRKIEV